MDSLPHEDLDQLAKLILAANALTGEEKEAAIEILNKMNTNTCQFIQSLMNLVSSERTDNIIQEAKAPACVAALFYIDTSLRKKTLSREQFAFVAERILKTIFSTNITFENQQALSLVLKKLLTLKKSDLKLRDAFGLIEAKMNTMTIDSCLGGFFAIEAFMSDMTNSTDFQWRLQLFQKVQEPILKVAKDLVEKIAKQMKENKETIEKDVNIENRLKGVLVLVNIFTKAIFNLREGFSQKKKKDNNNSDKKQQLQAVADHSTLEFLTNALDLQVPIDKQLSECVISTTGYRNIDKALNQIKEKIIKCFNCILTNMHTRKPPKDDIPFFAYIISTGTSKVVTTLCAVCEAPSFDLYNALTHQEFEDCLSECLILVNNLLPFSITYNDFFPFYKRLLLNVCMTLLKAGPEERDIFRNVPEEFLKLIEDVCVHQEKETPKSQAAKLLAIICEFMQGAETFIVTVLLKTMEYAILDNNSENIASSYPLLQEYIDTCFIQEKNPISQIETSLLSLTIIFASAIERKDLVELIVDFLEQFLPSYFASKTLDPLVRSRMCTFLCYFIDLIPKKIFSFIVEFLLESMSTDPDYPAVSLSAFDSFNGILQSKDIINRLKPHTSMIVLKIAEQSKVVSDIRIYEIIETLFTSFRRNLTREPELAKMLFQALIERLVLIYLDKKSLEGKDKTLHNKIWEIIRFISSEQIYISFLDEEFYKIMDPLFAMLLNNESVLFEEEILGYIAAVTKLTKSISPACWNIVKVFPNILVKSKGELGSLFPALNQVIISEKQSIYEDPNFVRTLVKLGIQGLQTYKSRKHEHIQCEFALLLQLILQHLKISDEDLNEILVTSCAALKNATPQMQVKLGGIFFSAFLSNFIFTLQMVKENNLEKDLLSLYLDKCINFKQVYDRKLFVIGFCSILTQGSNSEIISEKLSQVLHVVICFLASIFIAEQPAIKSPDPEEKDISVPKPKTFSKALKELLGQKDPEKGNEDEDENEQEKEEEENDDSGEDEVSDNDDLEMKVESKINKLDEFMVFKEAIRGLHRENKKLLQKLIQELPEQSREVLKDVFRTERVLINNKKGEIETKPRIILRAKGMKIVS